MEVLPRTEAKFTREELELAAKIAFYQHPEPDNVIPPDQELDIIWSRDFLRDISLIRVSGEVLTGEFN
jgi:hypothetical protein